MPEVSIFIHEEEFADDCPDTTWLPTVAANGWVVMGHDRLHHVRLQVELIRNCDAGCFYIAGAQSRVEEKMKFFLNAFEAIQDKANSTPRPYIYRVPTKGLLERLL